MNGSPFEKLRQWVIVIGITLVASSFWAMVFTGIVRYLFDIDAEIYGGRLVLFVWLPIGITLAVFLFPRFRKSLESKWK